MDLQRDQTHIAVCPAAGVGHLNPFLRLASTIAGSFNCIVSFVCIRPTISAAESDLIDEFFSSHPHIKCVDFHLSHSVQDTSGAADPFFLQFEAISLSGHLLGQQLTKLSPPLSAVFSDLFISTSIKKNLASCSICIYTLITTSAKFFSLMTNLPHLTPTNFKLGSSNTDKKGEVQIPGLTPLPIHCIPPPFFNPDHIFTRLIISHCQKLDEVQGFILNTFDSFEAETISALTNGLVLDELPPLFPVGPLQPYNKSSKGQYPPWLDNQPAKSVIYVSFGSRTAMEKNQISELGDGLEKSGFKFLWVIKTNKVDKEDEEEVRDLLGHPFLERTRDRALIVKEWVNQEDILAHPAVGAFLSHCGWNSVMEAARYGMPMMAWPFHGDQKINAEVVEEAGLGACERSWGWMGERLVQGDDIANKIKKVMTDEKLRESARRVGEEARKQWDDDGSSKRSLLSIMQGLKHRRNQAEIS